MKEYNHLLYPSLSKYVIEHIKSEDVILNDLKDWYDYCQGVGNYESFELAGPNSKYRGDVIDNLMKEWFNENGIDFKKFFEETTANNLYTIRYIQDSYSNVFSDLLIDLYLANRG